MHGGAPLLTIDKRHGHNLRCCVLRCLQGRLAAQGLQASMCYRDLQDSFPCQDRHVCQNKAAHVRGHHEAAVADDGQHGVAGPHDLGRDRAGQPGAHGRQRIVQQQAVGPVRRELPRKVHLPHAQRGTSHGVQSGPSQLADFAASHITGYKTGKLPSEKVAHLVQAVVQAQRGVLRHNLAHLRTMQRDSAEEIATGSNPQAAASCTQIWLDQTQ